MKADRQDFALRTRSPLFAADGSFESLPLAFTVGGTAIRGIPASFEKTARRESADANITRRSWTGTDRAAGLTVTVTSWEYRDFPVVE